MDVEFRCFNVIQDVSGSETFWLELELSDFLDLTAGDSRALRRAFLNFAFPTLGHTEKGQVCAQNYQSFVCSESRIRQSCVLTMPIP